MIIILAIGKLLRGDNADNTANCYPGSNLFEYVHASLPNPSMQHSQGRVAIETLTLLGVYLQAMNRKEEAYIYPCDLLSHTVITALLKQVKSLDGKKPTSEGYGGRYTCKRVRVMRYEQMLE
ncbi:hypothetical protein FOPG_17849 [Fusarium oxysporum f. sp. conglutinans race 2 54008]|uniref:Uncharacterized protein n=1 Tax=Fusarium oxysporum f. sp. conglutinans race 2 54008 TaxID=1089457 RepID=X0HXW1_FUSOX|nr:hypothetical protein FOPG_17849 [Fusarium oxysporum f. sp. conglutinans race 2 54008]